MQATDYAIVLQMDVLMQHLGVRAADEIAIDWTPEFSSRTPTSNSGGNKKEGQVRLSLQVP
jgi:hypothetical protein